ncbi:hypothetical protein TNCV_4643601 [Trichonephila clavipes]|nr:hypothetical protein TNCV_4643601 [Trichonephila clavipes]
MIFTFNGTKVLSNWLSLGIHREAVAVLTCPKPIPSNAEKFGNLCSLDKNDLINFMTVYKKEVDNDQVKDEVQLLTADLIRESLKCATSMEQHFLTQGTDNGACIKILTLP